MIPQLRRVRYEPPHTKLPLPDGEPREASPVARTGPWSRAGKWCGSNKDRSSTTNDGGHDGKPLNCAASKAGRGRTGLIKNRNPGARQVPPPSRGLDQTLIRSGRAGEVIDVMFAKYPSYGNRFNSTRHSPNCCPSTGAVDRDLDCVENSTDLDDNHKRTTTQIEDQLLGRKSPGLGAERPRAAHPGSCRGRRRSPTRASTRTERHVGLAVTRLRPVNEPAGGPCTTVTRWLE